MSEFVWLVWDNSDCEGEDAGYCSGKTDIEVFTNEQTAKQAADMRSKRYGGYSGRPDMHMGKVKISTKIKDF